MDNFSEAKAIKPYLRFRVGTVVYLTGDLARKCPLTISNYLLNENDVDYCIRWPDSQNKIETDLVADEALTE